MVCVISLKFKDFELLFASVPFLQYFTITYYASINIYQKQFTLSGFYQLIVPEQLSIFGSYYCLYKVRSKYFLSIVAENYKTLTLDYAFIFHNTMNLQKNDEDEVIA